MTVDIRKAALESIKTKGPWNTRDGQVLASEVFRVYQAVKNGTDRAATRSEIVDAVARVFGVVGLSDDRCNRALQVLRKAGLIKCFPQDGWRSL